MADPTKPSDLPSSPSPISPQIKIPPAGPQATPSGGPMPGSAGSALGPIPPNLPIKEGVSPAPTPAPRPPMQGPQPSPDIKLKPPSAPPAPSPVQTPPKAETPGGPVFKSSIRTMQEDITAIKKGQAPIGFQIEKQSEKDVTPPPVGAPGPKITMPPRPAPEVRLGELEKAKPLPGMKPPPAAPVHPVPPPPLVKPLPTVGPALAVPAVGGINWKRLTLLGGGLVVVVFLIWFFALRGPSAPEVAISPTPTYTATPTATPFPIKYYFSIVDSVSISLGPNFTDRFDSSINKAALTTSAGEPALYAAINPTSGQRYTFSEFLGGLLISAPTELVSAVYDNVLSWYLSAVYKSDSKTGYGFIVKLKNPTAALAALTNWELTMTQDLKDFLGFNPVKAASTTFLDNTYQGIAIRYRNFPDPNLTIDYAIVTASNGETYLVLASSREHIYAIIDKMK